MTGRPCVEPPDLHYGAPHGPRETPGGTPARAARSSRTADDDRIAARLAVLRRVAAQLATSWWPADELESAGLVALCHPDAPDDLVWLRRWLRWRLVEEIRSLPGPRARSPRRRGTTVTLDGPDGRRPALDLPDRADRPDAIAGVIDLVARIDRTPVPDALEIVLRLAAGWTLAEVGARLGVSESRVCQLRRQIARHLRGDGPAVAAAPPTVR